jgi:hypothetical protein
MARGTAWAKACFYSHVGPSASRPSGEWSDDDYDVLADGEVVGRIFKANAVGGCGHWPSGTTRTARRPTATPRTARRRWRIRQELAAGVAGSSRVSLVPLGG